MADEALNATTAMMNRIGERLALQQSALNVPYFDGHNIPLKNFLQNVHNGAMFVDPAAETSYVGAVLGKLEGAACDSTFGKSFNTVDQLTRHLKTRFAPHKTYSYYQHEIENIRMKRNETVNDFYDRLNILISGARVSLEDEYGKDAAVIIKPLLGSAIDAFLRGLPDDLTRAVDARNPKDLEEAVKHAVNIENRMRRGILPSGEAARQLMTRPASPCYPNSLVSPQTHFSNYRSPQRDHSHYPDTGYTDSRARSSSPTTSRYPTRILHSRELPEPYASSRTPPECSRSHQGECCHAVESRAYHSHPRASGNTNQNSENKPGLTNSMSQSAGASRPADNRSWRTNDSPSPRSRSPSPHNNKRGDNLNYQAVRRPDATTDGAITERLQTVRFAEPVKEYLRAGEIENHH